MNYVYVFKYVSLCLLENVVKISHVWLSIQKIALLENDESLANQSTFEQNMKNK